jgi:hypothetical protein
MQKREKTDWQIGKGRRENKQAEEREDKLMNK